MTPLMPQQQPIEVIEKQLADAIGRMTTLVVEFHGMYFQIQQIYARMWWLAILISAEILIAAVFIVAHR